MATGSGKTFTAANLCYRLIKHADAKRILFLVDRSNLGKQAKLEFDKFTIQETQRKFPAEYNVQHLTHNAIDTTSRVCISTVQRIFSILKGEAELDQEIDEHSVYELPVAEPVEVSYNPALPPDTFDVIIIDECHRSIYGLWRQVLEYFDAHLIGLTATPTKQTFGFFRQNLVMEYSHDMAVTDGVNVDFTVYKIQTAITQAGSTIEAGEFAGYRDRQTRKVRWDAVDEPVEYTAAQLDRAVVAEDQIRTVLQTFKDKLFTELFPGRKTVGQVHVPGAGRPEQGFVLRVTAIEVPVRCRVHRSEIGLSLDDAAGAPAAVQSGDYDRAEQLAGYHSAERSKNETGSVAARRVTLTRPSSWPGVGPGADDGPVLRRGLGVRGSGVGRGRGGSGFLAGSAGACRLLGRRRLAPPARRRRWPSRAPALQSGRRRSAGPPLAVPGRASRDGIGRPRPLPVLASRRVGALRGCGGLGSAHLRRHRDLAGRRRRAAACPSSDAARSRSRRPPPCGHRPLPRRWPAGASAGTARRRAADPRARGARPSEGEALRAGPALAARRAPGS